MQGALQKGSGQELKHFSPGSPSQQRALGSASRSSMQQAHPFEGAPEASADVTCLCPPRLHQCCPPAPLDAEQGPKPHQPPSMRGTAQ